MSNVHPFKDNEDIIIEKICDYLKGHKGQMAGLVIGILRTDGLVEYMDITDHPMTASWILRQACRSVEEE